MLGTPAATVNAWMRSQGHRDNILNAGFEEIGVGIVSGSPRGGLLDAGATYATEFGFREVAGGSSPTQASAASRVVDVTAPAAKKAPAKLKKLSAKAKRKHLPAVPPRRAPHEGLVQDPPRPLRPLREDPHAGGAQVRSLSR